MKNNQWFFPGLVLGLIVLTGIFLSYWRTNQVLGQPGIKVVALDDEGTLGIGFPDVVLDYQGRFQEVSQGELDALPDDTTINVRMYQARDGFDMQVRAVLMGTDRTSIHQPQFCLVGAGFSIDETNLQSLRVEGGEPYELPIMVLKSRKMVEGTEYTGFYIYWFVADGLATAHHWERMAWMAKGLFTTGKLQRWAYVSCFGIVPPGFSEEATLERIKGFLAHAVPMFQPRPQNLLPVNDLGENALKQPATGQKSVTSQRLEANL